MPANTLAAQAEMTAARDALHSVRRMLSGEESQLRIERRRLAEMIADGQEDGARQSRARIIDLETSIGGRTDAIALLERRFAEAEQAVRDTEAQEGEVSQRFDRFTRQLERTLRDVDTRLR